MCEVIYPLVTEYFFFFLLVFKLIGAISFQGRDKVKRRSPKIGLLRHLCWLGLSAQYQDRRSYQKVQKAFALYFEIVCMPLRINRAQLEDTFHYLLHVLNLNYTAHLSKLCPAVPVCRAAKDAFSHEKWWFGGARFEQHMHLYMHRILRGRSSSGCSPRWDGGSGVCLMPLLQGDRVVLDQFWKSRGSRGDCKGCPHVFPDSPIHPSAQKSMHVGMQVPLASSFGYLLRSSDVGLADWNSMNKE